MKAGDPVMYIRDPSLYGEMEVVSLTKHHVVCLIDPDSKYPTFESFAQNEVALPSAAQ